MKLKSLLFVLSMGLLTQAFATNVHMHPKADKPSMSKGVNYPGYCEIEVINDSYSDAHIYGTFDDHSNTKFDVPRYDSAHYINLFYYFYCHDGMFITIETNAGGVIGWGWVDTNTTVRIVPYLKNKAKVEFSPRQ
jgi:hypothetical protein